MVKLMEDGNEKIHRCINSPASSIGCPVWADYERVGVVIGGHSDSPHKNNSREE